MSKYILLYRGPASDMSDMSEEESKAVIAKWNEWIERVGFALVDLGAPMANGISIIDDGSSGEASLMNGYSIVQADDLVAARKLVDGHPFLSEGKGNFSVELFELMPVPM